MIQKSEIELKVPKNGFDIFSRPIPELEDKDIEVAHDIESKAWVISHMGEENVGKFGVGMKLGFALQCIKPDVMRCIFCFDDHTGYQKSCNG